MKTKILYILKKFPQTSETYIKTELEAVEPSFDLRVIAKNQAELPHRTHLDYEVLSDLDAIQEVIEDFRPHVLHSHWLTQIKGISKLAHATGTPFTIRTHSFDVLGQKAQARDLSRAPTEDSISSRIREAVQLVNDELCLGILAFPFVRPLFEKAGIEPDKIIDCFPVIKYGAFHDRGPNGDAVMNLGAALPKKKMEDFLELAQLIPELQFNLYAMGYQVGDIQKQNHELGDPVTVMPLIEPDDMPAEYKKHRWLVYTGSAEFGTVGWPMAVPEAQAAGVGVCMPNLRPDIADLVGGAGVIYDSIADVKDVIRGPVPEEMREAGFEHAKRSDIEEHKSKLTELWQKAASQGSG